jgi:hypothetical protein
MTQRALHGLLHAPAFLTAVCLAMSSADVAEAASASAEQAELNAQVNRPVDIASSAYQYRADRKAEENPPESWLAIMYYAKLPLNKPLDSVVIKGGD